MYLQYEWVKYLITFLRFCGSLENECLEANQLGLPIDCGVKCFPDFFVDFDVASFILTRKRNHFIEIPVGNITSFSQQEQTLIIESTRHMSDWKPLFIDLFRHLLFITLFTHSIIILLNQFVFFILFKWINSKTIE